jgi:hypothetical protein
MLGINPAPRVQVASVEIGSALSAGRSARKRLPAAIWIGWIDPSISVQVALVVVFAALLGFGRAPRKDDHDNRQGGHCPSYAEDSFGADAGTARRNWVWYQGASFLLTIERLGLLDI